MSITIKELKAYRAMRSECMELQLQIKELYTPVGSPSYSRNKNSPSFTSKTERTVYRILKLKDRLEEREEKLVDLMERIETWIDEQDNQEIKAIIRAKYINGKTWEQVTRSVYGGYADASTPRQKLVRYLKNTNGKPLVK